MKPKINIIFDFDGVILDSNKVKTNAFKQISLRYGIEKSEELVNYHIKNGGISRYEKIRWFVENILNIKNKELIDELINQYGEEVNKSFYNCQFRTNLKTLKEKLKGTIWSIASGGKEDEIKSLLRKESFLELFEAGVYGSPTPKLDIVRKIMFSSKEFNHKNKYILIGDSYYDFVCAYKYKINFIFASAWSEINNPELFFKTNKVFFIEGIENLNLKLLNSICEIE